MVNPRRSHRLPVLILLAAGLATGVACGGSGSGDGNGVASIKTASDKNSGSADAGNDGKDGSGKEKSPEEAMLAFARCMRENGVDMPDPDTSGGGSGVVTFRAGPASGGQKIDRESDTFAKAHEACKDLMGDAGPMNLSPEQQQEMQDQALAFSKCMREHGVNMPDPQFGGEGQVMLRVGPHDGLDPEDPKFQEAQQACGSAFGPAGAKGGAGLSVGGGKVDGPAGGKGGAMVVGGAASSTADGGAK